MLDELRSRERDEALSGGVKNRTFFPQPPRDGFTGGPGKGLISIVDAPSKTAFNR